MSKLALKLVFFTVIGLVSLRLVAQPPAADDKIKKIPDGKYYNFQAEYNCLRTNGKVLPSYKDSFEVLNGVVCNTGDACQSGAKKCQAQDLKDLNISNQLNQFSINKKIYYKQKNSISEFCEMPACAALPDICKFDELPPLDDKGCPMGCGGMVCKTQQKKCAELHCAAPPQGCEYDGKAPLDSKSCPTDCGKIICDSISKKEFTCPDIHCQKAPENCYLDSTFKVDENGCKTTCGQLICKPLQKKNKLCADQQACAKPPEGCYYVGEAPQDKNGCSIGCPSISCHKARPARCKIPECEPPTEFCRYDGNSPLDFNGCATGCGNIICNP